MRSKSPDTIRNADRPDLERPVIVWFRRDLRLADNPALAAAAASGRPIVPVYIYDSAAEDSWATGGASRWWLHHSLASLHKSLAKLKVRLIIRRGDAESVLSEIVRATNAAQVLWNRRYEPAAIRRDTRIKDNLKTAGIDSRSFNALLLHEPWTIATGSGGPYKVFTAFWKSCCAAADPAAPCPAPRKLRDGTDGLHGDTLVTLGLLPFAPDWAGGLRQAWKPGEAGAQEQLAGFIDERLGGYAGNRDRPDLAGTSRLSPHLHFGEIGPRQIWHAMTTRAEAIGMNPRGEDAWKFLSELGWREFSYHLLYHFPDFPTRNFRPDFDRFPWRRDAAALRAWQSGLTGYPIVDAGMRELWQTGWMHNRVRMIAASFLVKHLLLPWQAGATWFWDTLVDADLASNSAGWQWVAGSGADAAPYFRIFNPMLQGGKFDPDGSYVRRWVPELDRLPIAWLHAPWTAPPAALRDAGIRLGEHYPAPIVDHDVARKRALAAFRSLKLQQDAA